MKFALLVLCFVGATLAFDVSTDVLSVFILISTLFFSLFLFPYMVTLCRLPCLLFISLLFFSFFSFTLLFTSLLFFFLLFSFKFSSLFFSSILRDFNSQFNSYNFLLFHSFSQFSLFFIRNVRLGLTVVRIVVVFFDKVCFPKLPKYAPCDSKV